MNSKSINIVDALQNRESGLNDRENAWHQLLNMVVLPRVARFTTQPHVELLNFTPNGVRMLAVPSSRRHLIVYRFRFWNEAASLTEALVSAGNQGDTIFSTLFRQERVIELPWYNCRLKTNFYKFFGDDQHVLLYMIEVQGRRIERKLLVLNYLNGNVAEGTISTSIEGVDEKYFSTTGSTLAVWCKWSSTVAIYDIIEDRLVERYKFEVANCEKLGKLISVEGVLNARLRNFYDNLPLTSKSRVDNHDYYSYVETIKFLNSDQLSLTTEWRPSELVARNSGIWYNLPIKLLYVYSISAKETTEVRGTCRLAPEGRISGRKLKFMVKSCTPDVGGDQPKFLGHKTVSMVIEKYKPQSHRSIYYVHF